VSWCGPRTPSPTPNFVKNPLRGYTILANLYQKLAILAIWQAVSPHFQSHKNEIWREVPQPQCYFTMPSFVKKLLKGIYPFGANLYQKLAIGAIFKAISPYF